MFLSLVDNQSRTHLKELTISDSEPPKSRKIMRTPSSEDIRRRSKGCWSRTLFLTPMSSVNSVKPSSMWTPRVHSFPFQLQAVREQGHKQAQVMHYWLPSDSKDNIWRSFCCWSYRFRCLSVREPRMYITLLWCRPVVLYYIAKSPKKYFILLVVF